MKKDFLSEVEGKIVESQHGFKTWFDCLDASAKKELSSVKEKFRKGGYADKQKRAVAKAVIAAAKERGWKTSGIQGVIAWLDKP